MGSPTDRFYPADELQSCFSLCVYRNNRNRRVFILFRLAIKGKNADLSHKKGKGGNPRWGKWIRHLMPYLIIGWLTSNNVQHQRLTFNKLTNGNHGKLPFQSCSVLAQIISLGTASLARWNAETNRILPRFSRRFGIPIQKLINLLEEMDNDASNIHNTPPSHDLDETRCQTLTFKLRSVSIDAQTKRTSPTFIPTTFKHSPTTPTMQASLFLLLCFFWFAPWFRTAVVIVSDAICDMWIAEMETGGKGLLEE